MSQNKPTIDEHYIPQCYFKQFSPDGERIYQYDVITGKQSPVPVPIKSICYEKHLYEFRDNTGDFVHRNLIEKAFGIYEGEFAAVFRSIQSKSRYDANFNTLSFLTKNEKALLIFFLSTIIIRNPDILQIAQDTVMEFFGDRVPYILARNYVLQTCLPIYKALDVDERNLLNSIMRLFENMSFQIGITDREALLTCDNPAILFGNYHSAKLDKVIMPISPNLVLLMGPYENTRKHSYNRLIKLNYEDANTINRNVLKHCKRWIYSKALLTEKQIKWIINERATY